MKPISLLQLLIFAAYAFGYRPWQWALAWFVASMLIVIGVWVWNAIRLVRAADEAQRQKRGGR